MAARRRTLTSADEKYKRCRTVGHHWDTASPVNRQRPKYGVLMLWLCDGCSGFRDDIVAFATGELLRRNYHLPDDYSDVTKRTRAEWRKYYLDLEQPGIAQLDAARAKRTRRSASA